MYHLLLYIKLKGISVLILIINNAINNKMIVLLLKKSKNLTHTGVKFYFYIFIVQSNYIHVLERKKIQRGVFEFSNFLHSGP